MQERCPGSSNMRTPTLKLKDCPECGGEVELFSIDRSVKCGQCGFTVYNEIETCVLWCKYAKECVGEELYNKLVSKEGEDGT